jgi:hypothetical protein
LNKRNKRADAINKNMIRMRISKSDICMYTHP